MAPRRWLLFGIALASLVLMTWAGILLAFSVPIDEETRLANPGVGDRAVVLPIRDPSLVATHARGPDARYLAAGDADGTFPVNAKGVTFGRALAYVAPDANGSYDPATLDLVEVRVSNGTTNLTVDVAALAGGEAGFLVMPPGADEPTFFREDKVLGEVGAFDSTSGLGARFALGLVGFLVPLITLVATHRGGKRRGADVIVCRECRAPLPPSSDFCMRCGAWTQEASDA